jgi:hypothetical protein
MRGWVEDDTERLPWEPPSEMDEINFMTYEVCPSCMVKAVYRHAKLVCPTCGTILENCCGD